MKEEKTKPARVIKGVEDPTGKKHDVEVHGEGYTCVRTKYTLKCTPMEHGFTGKGSFIKKRHETVTIYFMQEYIPEVDIVKRGLRIKPAELRFQLDKAVNKRPTLFFWKDRPRPKETRKLEEKIDVLKTENSSLKEQMEAMAAELRQLKEGNKKIGLNDTKDKSTA